MFKATRAGCRYYDLDIGRKVNVEKDKVIIVGPEDIFEYFTANWPEWDAQKQVSDLNDMWDGLESRDLDDESKIVILNEIFDSPDTDDLEVAIATFAPQALILVVAYDNENKANISAKVAAKQADSGTTGFSFYYINTWEDPISDVQNAIEADKRERAARASARRVNTNPAAPQMNSTRPSVTPSEAAAPRVQEIPEAFKGKKGLVVASTSSKGGSGKTTVGLCTASMIFHASRLAHEQGIPGSKELSVCIVDMDTRDGQIGFLLDQTSPSALNIFLSPDKSTDVIRQNLIYNERLGIHALLAPKRARTADFLTPEFYQDVINKLSYMFDVVVLDTSVNYLDALLGEVVLPTADAVLFVTNLSIGSVYGMTRWMDEVTTAVEDGGSGIPKEKIGIVVNQSLPNVGIDAEFLTRTASGATMLVAIPLDTAAVVAASNHNSLSDIILHHDTISPSYFALAKKLVRDVPLVAPLSAIQSNNNKRPQQAATPVDAISATAATKKKKKGLFR